MILSFHPCFVGDANRLCAGREPDAADIEAMRRAAAVILPQGAPKSLYSAARQHCAQVFPNYDARFAFPGKIGQTELFRQTSVAFPETVCFSSVSEFQQRYSGSGREKLRFPLVFKFDWGGEGDTVFLARQTEDLDRLLEKAYAYQLTGQSGFLLQTFIPCGNRSLRVVIIYRELIAYWRIQPGNSLDDFKANLSKGATHDAEAAPRLRQKAMAATRDFCHKTGINLAGFDFLFAENEADPSPLFLEINFYFGRRGLGGSEAYYALLINQMRRWIQDRKSDVSKIPDF